MLQDCLWLLTAPPGHGIYINFTLLQTEAVNDYIAVWYGHPGNDLPDIPCDPPRHPCNTPPRHPVTSQTPL